VVSGFGTRTAFGSLVFLLVTHVKRFHSELI
jgi:hypothetical protein